MNDTEYSTALYMAQIDEIPPQKRLSIHTILLSYVMVYTSGPFTTLDTRKCVRNVSYNCFWDHHWGRTGQLLRRMDIPLNNQSKHTIIDLSIVSGNVVETHKQRAISYTGLEKGELSDWSSY